MKSWLSDLTHGEPAVATHSPGAICRRCRGDLQPRQAAAGVRVARIVSPLVRGLWRMVTAPVRIPARQVRRLRQRLATRRAIRLREAEARPLAQGRWKAYRPRKLMCLKASGEILAVSRGLMSHPSRARWSSAAWM